MKVGGGQGRGAWKGTRKGYVRRERGGSCGVVAYRWRCRGWRRGVGWRVERWSNTRCGEWRGGARDVELESGVVALHSLESGPGATCGVESRVVELLGHVSRLTWKCDVEGEASGWDWLAAAVTATDSTSVVQAATDSTTSLQAATDSTTSLQAATDITSIVQLSYHRLHLHPASCHSLHLHRASLHCPASRNTVQ
ncbi:hypothetical protein Pcinc_023965 [Petrolisthes cinctipes]|uniref:Uncharacterized protein n=1 Tax=Petrolisthes cinctipes TaxID=88211 RepID=A0AAE1FAU0_PETCI|nr:hypothetical protein Pcinc_023965 [Petrolisthes cinctipes]